MCAGKGCDFAAEIALGPVDAFAESETHEATNLDRRADFRLGLLDGLRDALLVVENESLIQQTDFPVERLEAGSDDLVDDVGGFARRLGLVGKHALFALDLRRIEPGRID